MSNINWKRLAREVGLYFIGALIIVAVWYVVSTLFTKSIMPENRDAVMLTIGAVIGWGTAVVQYFFGSSKGSADKSETMSDEK